MDIESRFRNLSGRFTLVVLATFPLFVIGLELIGVANGNRFYDFGAYYFAADRVLNGYPLYDWTTQYPDVIQPTGGPEPYLYAPIVVLLFVPFAVFPFEIAVFGWSAFSVTVYCGGIIALVRAYDVNLSQSSTIVLCICAIGFAPLVLSVMAGQISPVLAGVLCLGAASLENKDENNKPVYVGMFMTLPILVKAFYAPAGAILLRDIKRLLASIAIIIGSVVIGMIVFGLPEHIHYLNVLSEGKGWGLNPEPPGAWNMLDFKPLYLLGSLQMPLRIALFVFVTAVSVYTYRIDSESVDRYIYCAGLLALVIGGPTVNTFVLTALVPVVLILIITEIRRPDGNLTWILVSLLLLQAHPYTIEFLAKFGPQHIHWLRAFEPFVPLIQPATWGVFTLSIFVSIRLFQTIGEVRTKFGDDKIDIKDV